MIVVERGDTLYGLSREYGVDFQDLARANGLLPPYLIYVDQQLRLPGGGAQVASGGRPPFSPPLPPPQSNPDISIVPEPPVLGAPEPEPAEEEARPAPVITTAPVDEVVATPSALVVPETPDPPPRAGAKFQWPLVGEVISAFGAKDEGTRNDGINIAAPEGTPVHAAENGIVAYAGNELRGFGNLILIQHEDGWATAYAHNGRILVERGQRVSLGDTIATVGSTGGVDRPQLHFEIRQGTTATNPIENLPPLVTSG